MSFEVEYGDYREAGGVQFARKLEIGARGRPQKLSITVDSVEVNPTLDAARFRMPK